MAKAEAVHTTGRGRKRLSADALIAALTTFVEEKGRPPTARDAGARTGVPAQQTFVREFGSWQAALSAAGLPLKGPRGVPIRTDAELCAGLVAFADEHGRAPSYREVALTEGRDSRLAHAETYQRRFGSWRAAIEAAGLSTNERVTSLETAPCRHCEMVFEAPAAHLRARRKAGKHLYCSRRCAALRRNMEKRGGFNVSRLELALRERLAIEIPNIPAVFCERSTIGMELDFWFPSIRLGVEINGPTHLRPIYGEELLAKTRERDARKAALCAARGVRLVVIEHPENQPTPAVVDAKWNLLKEAILSAPSPQPPPSFR